MSYAAVTGELGCRRIRRGVRTKEKQARKVVKEGYAQAAKQGGSGYGNADIAERIYRQLGYSEEDLAAVPEGANLGLGCGNPIAWASLKERETVINLGSAAGFDSFLAANKVRENGKVIGVDMTPGMIEKARGNAEKGNYQNIEFRLGENENLPIVDNIADIVISNCVINLSSNKRGVFAEVFRVLKSGGRIMICDIVLSEPIPDVMKNAIEAYVGGEWAVMKDEFVAAIEAAGFQDVRIVDETSFPAECMANDPTAHGIVGDLNISPEMLGCIVTKIISVKIHGVKPG